MEHHRLQDVWRCSGEANLARGSVDLFQMILEIPSDSIASSIPSPMLAQDIGSDVLVGIAANNFSVIDHAAIARKRRTLIARRI